MELMNEDIRKIMGGNLLRLFQEVRDAANAGPWSYKRYAEGFGECTGGNSPL